MHAISTRQLWPPNKQFDPATGVDFACFLSVLCRDQSTEALDTIEKKYCATIIWENTMALLKSNLYKAIFIAFILSLFGAAEGQDRSGGGDWKGKFEYEAYLGRTVGGTGIVINYTIEIQSANASLGAVIKADGYMTNDEIRCDTKTEGNRIKLFFNSYPNGGTKNQFDVQLYEKGDLLLSLDKITINRKTRYLATFAKYNTEVKKKAYFRKTG